MLHVHTYEVALFAVGMLAAGFWFGIYFGGDE